MLDSEFTARLQDWLNQDPSAQSIEDGALILLQINRNRILYNNIIRKPEAMREKLVYELKKHLRIRLDGLTRSQVAELDRVAVATAKKTLEEDQPCISVDDDHQQKRRGIRDDHDALPEAIKALPERCGTIYQKMAKVYNELQEMDNAEPCDRYERLQILVSLDDEYRATWKQYDDYEVGTEVPVRDAKKEIDAARKYLYRKREEILHVEENSDKYKDILKKMQQRIDTIYANGCRVEGQMKRDLLHFGLSIPVDEPAGN